MIKDVKIVQEIKQHKKINMEKKGIDTTALAILLLAKVIAKSRNVNLTKNEKFAFAQIANFAGNNLPAFAELIDNFR